MSHTTITADAMLAAVQDGEDLVDWAEPNLLALNDEPLDAAARGGLYATLPEEYVGSPLLHFAHDPEWEPIPLMEALVTDFTERYRRNDCDRCLGAGQAPADQLWVPMGASVVVVHCCESCRTTLDADYSGLVWR